MRFKMLIVAVLSFCIILTGCAKKTDKDVKKENQFTSENITLEKDDNYPSGISGESLKSNNTESTEKIPDETAEDIAPHDEPIENMGVNPEDKSLDFERLKNTDNTKKSWWIRLNSENKPTEIPDEIALLISEYDGIYLGNTEEKAVYLTFDEGYENGYTPSILDSLKKYGVKALFFVTGSYVQNNKELVERMISEGHEIGSHTVKHPSLPDIDDEQLEEELLEFEKTFHGEFGKGFRFLRPPKGEYSERTLAAAQMLEYKTVFWSFAYHDWDVNNQKGADYAYNKVMDNLHNGAVILLHAVSKDNAEAMDRIIEGIMEKGYAIKQLE